MQSFTLLGLSDEARSNFTVMKDLAVHTRVAPDARRRTMVEFMEKMNRYLFC